MFNTVTPSGEQLRYQVLHIDVPCRGAKELDRGLSEEVRIQLLETVETAGYVREGVMRRSVIKEGIVLDQALYAITDQDLASSGQFGRNRSL
jgi:hypothetical protein